MTPKAQAEAAQARIREYVNRSSAQHQRAVHKAFQALRQRVLEGL